jgi:hypothetical protein
MAPAKSSLESVSREALGCVFARNHLPAEAKQDPERDRNRKRRTLGSQHLVQPSPRAIHRRPPQICAPYRMQAYRTGFMLLSFCTSCPSSSNKRLHIATLADCPPRDSSKACRERRNAKTASCQHVDERSGPVLRGAAGSRWSARACAAYLLTSRFGSQSRLESLRPGT